MFDRYVGVAMTRTGGRVFVAAVAALAAAMVLSPLAVVMLAALLATTIRGVRGLDGTERRVILAMLVLAIAVRLAMIAGLFLVSDPAHIISFPFDGDGLWVKRRALWVRNTWLGVPIHTRDLEDAFTLYGWSSYIYVLAYLQYLFGPSPYAVHLVSVWCHLTASVLLFRLVRRAYAQVAAAAALTVMLFLPSLLTWSVAAMRESFYFLALSAIAATLVSTVRAKRPSRRLAAAAACAAAIWLITTIRNGALPIAAASVGVALVGTFIVRRPYILLLVLALAVPSGQRVLKHPDAQMAITEQVYKSATTHRGNVVEKGHSYKLLDERLYWVPILTVPGGVVPVQWSAFVRTITWPEVQRYLVRSLVTVVTVPWPWQNQTPSEVLYIPQQMFWYVLLALAAIGAVAESKGDVLVTWVLIGIAGVGVALMAPSEGNIGTLVRHRDTVMPFIACLSGAGLAAVLSWGWGWSSLTLPRPPRPIGRWRIAARQSRSARLLNGSVVAAAVAAFWRPTIGHDGREAAIAPHMANALHAAFACSRIGRGVSRALDCGVRAWRHSAASAAAASVGDEAQALEPWERVRVAAVVVLASSLLAGPMGWAMGHAWPTAIVWGAAVAAAGLVVVGARQLRTGAPAPVLPARPELTV